jgi:hypothetical protein
MVVAAGMAGAWLAPVVARAAGSRATTATLSYAGTVRQNGAPVTTPQTLTFVFKKNDVEVCRSPDVAVTPDESGQFVAAIPHANCPSSLFDGTEVKIDIAVNGDLAVTAQPITSVPSAKFAEQFGFPDCPVGYARDAAVTSYVLCRFGSDEVVRVGTRHSAFWIDRYEASVWDQPDGTGKNYGPADPYPIPQNGQLTNLPKAYAVSKIGVQPSVSITWFQADVACRASGKRLPFNAEWAYAASGTYDFGDSAGEGASCRNLGGLGLTGAGSACTSVWGAQDMIGNAAEWIAEWYAAPPLSNDQLPVVRDTWGPGYASDLTTNLASFAGAVAGWMQGIPAGVLRGGGYAEGTGGGVFSMNLSLAPSNSYPNAGFRCVIPR